VFKFFKDQASITSALRSKAIDMTWFKDPKVSAQIVKTSPDLVSAPGKTSRTFPVWLNLKAKPFNDVRVRRALSLATDRRPACRPCWAAPARSARWCRRARSAVMTA
jgi:peptide/nickel transport system substrate-binding protein